MSNTKILAMQDGQTHRTIFIHMLLKWIKNWDITMPVTMFHSCYRYVPKHLFLYTTKQKALQNILYH